MVKFSDSVDKLNYKVVGRKKSVSREVSLLTHEWWFEKSYIRKKMWTIKDRTFVSVYCGRVCIGTVFFVIMNKSKQIWELSNAVVLPGARGHGIGKHLAELAVKFVFNNGCKELYLGAECVEISKSKGRRLKPGEIRKFQKVKDSRAFKFWSRLNFKRVSKNAYSRASRKLTKSKKFTWEGFVPMKMTHGSRAQKGLPDIEKSLDSLFAKLPTISKKVYKPRKRVPMVRLCGNGKDLCILAH